MASLGRGDSVLKPVKLWEVGRKDLMERCWVLALKAAISSSVKASVHTHRSKHRRNVATAFCGCLVVHGLIDFKILTLTVWAL